MNKLDDKDLWVSWEEYHSMIEKLVLAVYSSNWEFDQILCLARGGLRPGDIFSRIFDVPLAILSTSSYRENAGTVQSDLDIGQHIAISRGTLSGKVLVVDDLVDSGVTLNKVLDHLKQCDLVSEVKSAVIWWKSCSSLKPDFYVDYLPTSPWVHQPFEEYDSLRPDQLLSLDYK
jgi:hypoxanthine phosphoribosyltransferase